MDGSFRYFRDHIDDYGLSVAIAATLWEGIGMWGLNKTVGWAWDITNFVWWVGIGHAGTLISAVLLLFRQKWRMAINRAAEGDDDFRGYLCGTIPCSSHGKTMVRSLLGTTITKHIWFTLGELQLSTTLGRIRYIDLFLGFIGILVSLV